MKSYRIALVGILVLAFVLPAIPAGRRILWSSNEARFVLLAQDILDHGHWLIPELRGQLYLYKPQLFIWAIALAALPAGRVSELSGAIPSLLSAVASVGAIAAIGTLLWNGPAGLLAGLILATAPPLFLYGHTSIPDMMLGAFLTWSLYWFLRAWRSGWARGPLAGFYICVALAVASKGPAGYAGLIAAAITVVGSDGPRGLVRLRPGLGALILIACALPWIVPYYLWSHGAFQSNVLRGEYAAWVFEGTLRARLEGFARTLGTFLPWSIFLVAAPWWWWRAPDDGRRRVLLWTATIWVLFVMSGKVRSHYPIPVYPLLALLTGEFLARDRAPRSRPLQVAVALAAVYAVATAVLVLVNPLDLGSGEDTVLFPEARWERGIDAAVLILGAVVALLLARRGAWRAVTATVALSLTVALVLSGITYPARQARDYDVRPLVAAATAHLAPGEAVVGYPDLPLPYDFYLRRPVVEIGTPREALNLLASSKPGQILITSRGNWDTLATAASSRWRPLATHRAGGREIVVAGSSGP